VNLVEAAKVGRYALAVATLFTDPQCLFEVRNGANGFALLEITLGERAKGDRQVSIRSRPLKVANIDEQVGQQLGSLCIVQFVHQFPRFSQLVLPLSERV
jgi:hypothetical protein